MNLQAALDQFLLQLAADGRSPHTVAQYRRHGTALATWLASTGASTNVADLKPETLARFFAADAAKNSCRGGVKRAVSLNAMRTSVRCFCSHLHQSGLIATNPARLLRRARAASPPPRAVRDDEMQRLRAVLAAGTGPEAERDRVLVELLVGTGVRLGSAIAADIEDLDLAHSEIALKVTKNSRPAVAVLPAATTEMLRRFIGNRTTGPLFLASDRRVSVRHVQRRLSSWFAAAGIRGRSAHSLRHSYATALLAKTGDLRLVQAAMHHASIVSTTIYTTVDKAQLRAAVGAQAAAP